MTTSGPATSTAQTKARETKPVAAGSNRAVLIVEDDPKVAVPLKEALAAEGYEVRIATTVAAAKGLLADLHPQIVLLDCFLPGGRDPEDTVPEFRADQVLNAIDSVREKEDQGKKSKKGSTPPYVVLMTREGNALQLFDRIVKWWEGGRIVDIRSKTQINQMGPEPFVTLLVRGVNDLWERIDNQPYSKEIQDLKDECRKIDFIVGASKMEEVIRKIDLAAPTLYTVMITGETGTGKERVAQAVHRKSKRSHQSFLAVNCASLPEPLLESEMFGHIEGSFTGAVKNTVGLFQAASGGTIFLDEIGAMPMSIQVKLLRVLQEHEIRPVGGTVNIPVDVRVVAASNIPPEDLLKQGKLREDLFYRLDVVRIHIPPLRERAGDILLIAANLMKVEARANEFDRLELDEDAKEALTAYAWPGNVRELENVIKVSTLNCKGRGQFVIRLEDLPPRIGATRTHARPKPVFPPPPATGETESSPPHQFEVTPAGNTKVDEIRKELKTKFKEWQELDQVVDAVVDLISQKGRVQTQEVEDKVSITFTDAQRGMWRSFTDAGAQPPAGLLLQVGGGSNRHYEPNMTKVDGDGRPVFWKRQENATTPASPSPRLADHAESQVRP